MKKVLTIKPRNRLAQLKGRWVLLLLMFFYITAALVPFFISLPYIPGMEFFGYFLLVMSLLLGSEYIYHKITRVILSFAILSGFYFLIDNYSAGHDHENPIFTSISLLEAMSMYLILIQKRFLSDKFENILFKTIIAYVLITSLTTIYGLFQYPDAARFLVGTTDFETVRQYFRLNIGSYRILFFFSVLGPCSIYIYIKFKRHILYLILGITCCFAILMGQIMGIILVMVLVSFLCTVAYSSNSIKNFLIKSIALGFSLYFFKFILTYLLRLIKPLLSRFDFLVDKLEEIELVLTSDLAIQDTDDLTNTEGYYERLQKSLNSFYESPFFGGGDSGAHHYWADYLAENGIFGLALWVIFLTQYWKLIKERLNYEAQYLVLINIFAFIFFGLTKNIVIAQQAMLTFFVFPFIALKLTEDILLKKATSIK